jgi:glycerol dehydrogenase
VEQRPAAEIAQVIDFCRSVGLPTTLAEIGLADADDATIALVAAATCAPQESAHNEPFPVTPELIAAGIRGADLLSRSRA